jgi:hypothetical protein
MHYPRDDVAGRATIVRSATGRTRNALFRLAIFALLLGF